MMSPTVRARARRRYDHFAPLITLVLGVVGVSGILLGATAMYVNGLQDQQRDSDQSRLLACFDTYAGDQSTSSQAVREASQAKDQAATEAWDALGDLTTAILLENTDAFKATIAKLNRKIDKHSTAADAVEQARVDNPIPGRPSEVCAEHVVDE